MLHLGQPVVALILIVAHVEAVDKVVDLGQDEIARRSDWIAVEAKVVYKARWRRDYLQVTYRMIDRSISSSPWYSSVRSTTDGITT